MKKNFIIDTNVVVQDPNCVFKFDNNDVYIATSVLSELDKIKSKNGEVAKSVRVFSRLLDTLLNKTGGNVVKLGKGLGTLYIVDDTELFQNFTDDSLIILAKKLQTINHQKYIIISNDINLKIKARAVGIDVERYYNNQIEPDKSNKLRNFEVDADVIDFIYDKQNDGIVEITDDCYDCFLNEYVILKNEDKSALVRYIEKFDKKFFALVEDFKNIYGISPKNAEQRALIDALISSDIDLVVCNGVAGSGKTLLSLASALHCLQEKIYNKILVYKSIIPFGNDIGYLKGDKEDKLRSWLQPFYDNLEYIFETCGTRKKTKDYDYLFDAGLIEIDALTYIRGRSIPKRFIIIDEVQNLSQKEIKTILTRVGENSKLVLLGDTQQIDNMYLDEYNNALTYVADKMRGCDNVAVISLSKSERSRLAQIAIDRL